jgi:Fe-S cluster biogenesis protein NfuA
LPVEEETDTIKKIKTILEEYIRPAVEQDGGAITYHSFQDGVVKVKLQGILQRLPIVDDYIEGGYRNLFTRMMPGEVTAVEALN